MVRFVIGSPTPIVRRGSLHLSVKEKKSKSGERAGLKKLFIISFFVVFIAVILIFLMEPKNFYLFILNSRDDVTMSAG